jgi:oligoendopeptidase F
MQAAVSDSFVPVDLDPSDFARIEPLGKALLERRVASVEELRQWVADLSRLFELIHEYGSRCYIAKACHTDDPQREKAYLHWVREIQPKIQPMFFELQKRYLRNPQRHDLYEAGFAIMELDWQAEVDIFRPQNIPLFTREQELNNEYDKTMAAMTVEFRGQTYTLQQMARFLEEPDRPTRQQAWQLVADRRMTDRVKIDALFEQLLDLRRQIAVNAGFQDYRQYIWKSRKRFDYSPDDCLAFGDAIESVCVPLVDELDEQRKSELGVELLRPWDSAVDAKSRPPLRPFAPEDIDGFVETTRRVFDRISPALARQFDTLRENGDLDLGSRKGKQPGGFQSSLEAVKRPFIFMNAAGLQRDVETLLHEGGHAFHYMAAREQWNLFVRHAPLEFCEVASMSMELLADDHLGLFYESRADALRAKRVHLEGIVRFMPWMATIDGFQHWLYTHPGHSAAQRTAAWRGMLDRFGGRVVDWSGLEAMRESMWHRQLHLFHVPFYYIEYGIAQLGALQVWLNYRRDPQSALEQLLEAFALGGTRPLPELFATAGIRFAFNEATLRPLIEAVGQELATLPA